MTRRSETVRLAKAGFGLFGKLKSVFTPTEKVALLETEDYKVLDDKVFESAPVVLSHTLGSSNNGFFIEDLPDKNRYCLHNVCVEEEPFKGCWVVEWGKGLLRNGAYYSQSGWSELTKNEEEKVSPAPFIIASILGLHDYLGVAVGQQKGLAQLVWQMFKDDFAFAKNFILTSTRLRYTPTPGVDVVHHWHGYTSLQKDVTGNISGNCGYILNGFEDFSGATLGTRDVVKLEKAIVALTGLQPYFYRLQKRSNAEERVLVLGCSGGGSFGVGIGGYGYWTARGLVARRAQKIST